MSNFLQFLENGTFARASKKVVANILKYSNVVPARDSQLIRAVSGFPETGRAIWLMPMADGATAVIECPIDDPSPFTMIDALLGEDLSCWKKVKSPNFTNKSEELCRQYGIPAPATTHYMPAQYDFPATWIRHHGGQGKGMQIHCILSRTPISKTRSLVGYPKGGAYCTFTKVEGSSSKPASRGCGFVARSAYFDGRLFADGLANEVFPLDYNTLDPATLFNFTDAEWNREVWSLLRHKSIQSLLLTFTTIIRKQLDDI